MNGNEIKQKGKEVPRPTGLTVCAIINFIFVGLISISFLMLVYASHLYQGVDISLTPYTILSPLITGTLLLISGIGFLTLHYFAGYILGLAFCVGSLSNILIYNMIHDFHGFPMHIISLIYPIVLLCMLLFKYRPIFQKGDT